MNSLSNVDLELMLIYCCNATYKFLVPTAEISTEEISKFVALSFNDESERINISSLMKLNKITYCNYKFRWCLKITEIREYFNIIKKDFPSLEKKK